MLTIFEILATWSGGRGEGRREGNRGDADAARADHEAQLVSMPDREDVRYVLLAPGDASWTEARGRSSIIEHLACSSAPAALGEDRPLIDPRRLRELVQLHRPSLILCPSPALLPALVQWIGLRLDPRPAVVGRWPQDLSPAQVVASLVDRAGARLSIDRRGPWVQGGERAMWWWIRRSYGSLDAVFVADRAQAQTLLDHGVDRLYLVPPGDDAEGWARALICAREIVEARRAGRRIPPGIHERPSSPRSE